MGGGLETSLNGAYTANGLPADSYRVCFSPPVESVYCSECYNDKPNLGFADPVMVIVPHLTSGIDAVLKACGGLSGTVKNGQGVGIANVRVQVYDAADTDMSAPKSSTVVTDQNGSYTVNGLPTDSYKIFFSGASVIGYFSEWYNNKASQDIADPVSVTAPHLTSGIGAVLEPAGSISGAVRDQQGIGIRNVSVSILDANGYYFSGSPTNQDGNYTASGLPTGSYRVLFSPMNTSGYSSEWYNDKPNRDSADPVAVTVPNITSGIDAVLELGGSISGTVKNGQGVGIANVQVQVYDAAATDTSAPKSSTVVTDQSGSYTVNGLPTGSYKIFFSGASIIGYFSEWYNNKASQDIADPVSVTAPHLTSGIDAVLEPAGSISGIVRDEHGIGIRNVSVGILDANGYYLSGSPTNQDGSYTASGLPTGSYRVFFSPMNTSGYSGYSSEWYNNKPNRDSADPVAVTVPNITSGIDAVLELGGNISGTVKNGQGVGIANVQIQVYDAAEAGMGPPKATVTTIADGSYTVNCLPTGSYKLFFTAIGYFSEWYNNQADKVSASPVSVTAPNTTSGINAVLERSGGISGTVKNGSGVGIRNVWVGVSDANGAHFFSASTDEDGKYTVSGLADGSYKVRFQAPNGYLGEWYNNKTTYDAANLVVVTVPKTTSGINAVLAPAGSISGAVKNEQGAGIVNGYVQVYDLNGMWAAASSTGQNGAYTVYGLPAGSYKVFFSPPLGSDYSSEWYNNKASRDSAQPVAVTVSNTTSGIDAVLQQGGIITVTSPNGGEAWEKGSTYDITWAYAGDPGAQVKIQFLKAGTVVKTIAAAISVGEEGQGSYPWTIPAAMTSGKDYKIKVIIGSCADESDNFFSIKAPQPLTVLAPNGGENWKVGSKVAVAWKYKVDIGPTVKIELLKGDKVVNTPASAAPSGSSGAGSFLWTVPKTLAYADNYRIRVTGSANPSYTDTSDAVFTISGPTLDVTAPDGGESWPRGSQRNVTWTYTENPGGKVKIQLLKGGTVVRTITSGVSIGAKGQGSFSWTVPGDLALASNYRIKITHTAISGCKATSNSNFSVAKTLAAASAGPDQKVAETAEVKLSGANSRGFDKGRATFSWTQLDGPQARLSSRTALEAQLTAPVAGTDGASLMFQLTITGEDGSQAQDSCIVNVTETNAPPTAEAGPTQTVAGGALVALDGSASFDPDDGIASTLWKQLAGLQVTLSDPSRDRATFTAPELDANDEALVFQLTVTDQGGLRSRDTCIVNVTWANQPPKADAGVNLSARPGAKVMLDGSPSSDPEGNIVSYRWTQLTGPPVTLSDPNAVQPSFIVPATRHAVDDLIFQLTVTDAGGLQDKARVVVKVDEVMP